MSTDPATLRDALEHAIKIIEWYQRELEHETTSQLFAMHVEQHGGSLADAGFCQGVIFREAIGDIRGLAGDGEAGIRG